MGFFSFFGKIKSFVERAVGLVKQYVPEEVLTAAVDYVRRLESSTLDNATRRQQASAFLMAKFHLPESVANLAVELAVNIVKKELN